LRSGDLNEVTAVAASILAAAAARGSIRADAPHPS
jgi:hypothetical protein